MAWTPNVIVPNQKSKASPALGATGTALHMVHLGDTSNQIWHSMYNGNQWSRNTRILNQKSKASPALAGGSMVHLGDSSNRIWTSRWVSGGNWLENQILLDVDPVSGRGGSNTSPALALIPTGAIPGEGLAMVYKEANGSSISYYFLFSMKGTRTGGLTRFAPAIAFHGGTLHMVHIGKSSNDLWHSIWDKDREVWTENKIEGQKSKASPALSSFNGRLHMVHLGNSSNNIWHSVYVEELGSWTEDRIESQRSKAPPALGVFNGKLHMVHLGNSSNNIWYSQYDTTAIGRSNALSVLDSILSDEGNLVKLRQALQEKFDNNPEHFFRTFVLQWAPHDFNLNHSGEIDFNWLSERVKQATAESPAGDDSAKGRKRSSKQTLK